MSRSVSKSILAAVLASVFVLVSVALYRDVQAQPGAQEDLAGAVESPGALESPGELESLPEGAESVAEGFFWGGACAYTCEPCWHYTDCPLLDGAPQDCAQACY